MKKNSYSFSFGEITKGEIIIVSIALVIWTTLCVFINMAISNSITKKNEIYYKAVQISEDADLFEYAMKTNAGNCLVYGTAASVDSVSHEMLKGEYLAIKISIDKYVEKIRYEDIKDEDGEVIGQKAVHYEEWDNNRTLEYQANTINFLGKDFSQSTLDLDNYSSLRLNSDTVSDKYVNNIDFGYIYPEGSLFPHVGDYRYEFYIVPKEQKITVLADLRDNTMYNINGKDNVKIYYGNTIEEVMANRSDTKGPNIAFSIIWYVAFIGGAYFFFTERNKWADC